MVAAGGGFQAPKGLGSFDPQLVAPEGHHQMRIRFRWIQKCIDEYFSVAFADDPTPGGFDDLNRSRVEARNNKIGNGYSFNFRSLLDATKLSGTQAKFNDFVFA